LICVHYNKKPIQINKYLCYNRCIEKNGDDRMKILVLGGTGSISARVIDAGIFAGHEMYAFNRGSREGNKNAVTIIGDRHSYDLKRLAKLHPDVVIDMIAFDPSDAKDTIDAFDSCCGQIIFTSSIAAYERPYKSMPVKESAEGLLTSDAYTYGYLKAEMERYIDSRKGDMKTPITVVRPSLIFGVGGMNMGLMRQNYNIFDRIKNGRPMVMLGEGVIPWGFTFSPDIARAYIALCGNEKAFGESFHFANDTFHNIEDLYLEAGRILGIEPKLAYIPTEKLYKEDPVLFGHYYHEKKYPSLFSIEKFRYAVGDFKFEYDLSKGLMMMLEWYESVGIGLDIQKDEYESLLCSKYYGI